MIIWIASYPKSGNTWIRLFLNSLIYSDNSSIDINDIKIRLFPIRKDFESLSENINDVNELIRNCLYSQIRLNLDKSVKIFKSHNALWQSQNYKFTNEENTLATVYIVRDPRNIITSIKNHYSKDDYLEALKFITDEKKVISSNQSQDAITLISSWKTNYISWKAVNKNYLLIKYEDLLLNLEMEVIKIINYLKKFNQFEFDENKIKKAISSSSFDDFKKMEKKGLFKEIVYNKKTGEKKNFFHLGPNNDWKKFLNDDIRKKIEENFKNEMEELGYL